MQGHKCQYQAPQASLTKSGQWLRDLRTDDGKVPSKGESASTFAPSRQEVCEEDT